MWMWSEICQNEMWIWLCLCEWLLNYMHVVVKPAIERWFMCKLTENQPNCKCQYNRHVWWFVDWKCWNCHNNVLYYVDSIVLEEPKFHQQTMIFKLLPELFNKTHWIQSAISLKCWLCSNCFLSRSHSKCISLSLSQSVKPTSKTMVISDSKCILLSLSQSVKPTSKTMVISLSNGFSISLTQSAFFQRTNHSSAQTMKIYSELFNTFACFPFVSIINLAMFYILFFYLENYFKLNLNYFTYFFNYFLTILIQISLKNNYFFSPSKKS